MPALEDIKEQIKLGKSNEEIIKERLNFLNSPQYQSQPQM